MMGAPIVLGPLGCSPYVVCVFHTLCSGVTESLFWGAKGRTGARPLCGGAKRIAEPRGLQSQEDCIAVIFVHNHKLNLGGGAMGGGPWCECPPPSCATYPALSLSRGW